MPAPACSVTSALDMYIAFRDDTVIATDEDRLAGVIAGNAIGSTGTVSASYAIKLVFFSLGMDTPVGTPRTIRQALAALTATIPGITAEEQDNLSAAASRWANEFPGFVLADVPPVYTRSTAPTAAGDTIVLRTGTFNLSAGMLTTFAGAEGGHVYYHSSDGVPGCVPEFKTIQSVVGVSLGDFAPFIVPSAKNSVRAGNNCAICAICAACVFCAEVNFFVGAEGLVGLLGLASAASTRIGVGLS